MAWDETDEARHARLEEAVKKNSQPLRRCITCRQYIQPHHQVIESIHGPYHGPPNDCVNGR